MEARFSSAPLEVPAPRAFPRTCTCRPWLAIWWGLAQFAGGLAILSGVLIRLGAACIIVVMLGAIFLVHLPHGFDISKGSLEYALMQLLIALALLITGADAYSLASRLPKPLQNW